MSKSTTYGKTPPPPVPRRSDNNNGGAPNRSDEAGGIDPISGKMIRGEEVYARTEDGLVFANLQNQQLYYKAMAKGFVVEWQDGKPKLVESVVKENVWELRFDEELGAKINRRSVIPPSNLECHGLTEGEYDFIASAPNLKTDGAWSMNTHEVTVSIEVKAADGSTIQSLFVVQLTVEVDSVTIPFKVISAKAPAKAIMKFSASSLLNKLFVTAKISRRVSKINTKEMIEEARRKSKANLQPGEFIVEMEKDATGVGMSYGWDQGETRERIDGFLFLIFQ